MESLVHGVMITWIFHNQKQTKFRADRKGGVEDLEKARVYLNWEIGMEDRIAIVTDIKQTEWDGRNPNEG